MRKTTLSTALILVLLAMTLAGVAGAEEHRGPDEDVAVDRVGPAEWIHGMEWAWENDTVHQRTVVTDETAVRRTGEQYNAVFTQSFIRDEDGPNKQRVTAWTQGGLERIYDKVTIDRENQETLTVIRHYTPPAPYPFWAGISPGELVEREIQTTTEYMVGLQPVGSEHHNWTWTVGTSDHIYERDTPAGTFEGYNVSVHKQDQDSDAQSLYRYFYSPETHTFAETLDADGGSDFEMTDLMLNPPPTARTHVRPSLPTTNETVTLDARGSHDSHGELTRIAWTLPNGTTVEDVVVNVTFSEPGEKRATLTLESDTGRTLRVPVTFRVVEAGPEYRLVGPDATAAGEPTRFQLAIPEDGTLDRASWKAENVPSQEGAEAVFAFPRAGSYNVSATYVDKNGTTGTLHHEVHVVAGTEEGPTNVEDAAERREAGFLSPENDTQVEGSSVLVVLRTVGLEDPHVILESGLRVPVEADAEVVSERLPAPESETTFRLVDGEQPVDQLTVDVVEATDIDDPDAVASSEDAETTPGPLVPTVLALLAAVSLIRRFER